MFDAIEDVPTATLIRELLHRKYELTVAEWQYRMRLKSEWSVWYRVRSSDPNETDEQLVKRIAEEYIDGTFEYRALYDLKENL